MVTLLTFDVFRAANMERLEDFAHMSEGIKTWRETDWGCALAGEVGELCNNLKKLRRGQDVPLKTIMDEIGDVLTYLDLLAAYFNVDLAECAVTKFNEVSDRIGSDVKL